MMINNYVIITGENAHMLMGIELYEITSKVVSLGLINFIAISSEKILFQVVSEHDRISKISIPYEGSVFYVKPSYI